MAFNYTKGAVSPTTSSSIPRQRRKLVIVGNGGTGKTSLLMVYARNNFPTEYVPTVFENFVTEVILDKKIVDLALWDTAGQEDYDRLRPLSYPDTDVVVLCFAVNDRESLKQIVTKWNPEVDHFCEGVPKVLVALKTDLRAAATEGATTTAMTPQPSSITTSNRSEMVSTEEGQEAAYKIGAYRYIESSAKLRENIGLVFETAIQAIWDRERRMSRRRRKQTIKKIATRCSLM